jgi:hypothetical protein
MAIHDSQPTLNGNRVAMTPSVHVVDRTNHCRDPGRFPTKYNALGCQRQVARLLSDSKSSGESGSVVKNLVSCLTPEMYYALLVAKENGL